MATVPPEVTDSSDPGRTTDRHLDAGLAAAFGPDDDTAGGWTQPPLLRDDPSDFSPVVRPDSAEMPRTDGGRYQLLGEIARGGMGVVLKGRDPDLGRDLAVKVLKLELAGNATAEQRFVEEAQVGGQLQHPGIVPVYELGRFVDGRPYFTMKLVKGRTLAALLAERVSPATDRGRFLKIFEDVCQTVAYAHSRGVVHRDLKPANVMVGAFGQVQVMDWGLAKLLPQGGIADEPPARPRPEVEDEPTIIRTVRAGSAGGSETQAGSVMGTPAFMPPEQAGGEIDKLDERADVFGLGAVLCVILTGKPPFVGESGEAVRLMAVRGRVADAFARLDGSGGDAELIALCKRCLAAERDQRPRNAAEVAAAVANYLAGVEDRVRKAEVERAAAAAEARGQRKRWQLQLALVTVVGLLLIGSGAAAWWQDRERRAAAAQRAVREQSATALLDKAGDAIRTGKLADAGTALAEAREKLPDDGAADLRERFDRTVRARDAVLELEELLVRRLVGDLRDEAARDTEYPAVFRRLGVAISETDPGAAAELIRQSPARDRLTDGLDEWLSTGDRRRLPAVWAVLTRVDSDPHLVSARENLGIGFGGDPVQDIDPVRLPPGLAAALTHQMPSNDEIAGRDSGAIRFLRAAWAARPDRFDLSFRLARRFSACPQPMRAEAIGYYRAALGSNPNCAAVWSALGEELLQVKNLSGSADSHRRALQLDPTRIQTHHRFSFTLVAQKQYEEALSHLERALSLVSGRSWDAVPIHLRYDAACCALLAAIGGGPKALPGERAKALRAKALQWLTAEREYFAASRSGIDVPSFLRHWFVDGDLASVREHIDDLPTDERASWRQFWAQVRDLHDSRIPRENGPPPRVVKP